MKRMLLPGLFATLIGTAPALSAECTGPGYAKGFAVIEAYFRSEGIALFNIQLQQNALAGRQVLTPDGVWGPASAKVICESLMTYEAINGMAPDRMITSPDEAAYFARWMGAMARMSLNPGKFEAPD